MAYEAPLATEHLAGPPWILSLGGDQFSVIYINAGFRNSAVFYGVVDFNGAWISGPTAVTPIAEGWSPGPSGVMARLDGEGVVHLAWALWDSENDLQSYHYLQLEASGLSRLAVEVWAESLEEIYSPVPVGLRIQPDSYQIAAPVNNSHHHDETPSFVVSALDSAGTLTGSPHPVPDLDETLYFLPRRFPPGVDAWTRGSGDSDASFVEDERGNTLYLWVDARQWFVGRSYHYEKDLRFQREGPAGDFTKVLTSTEDTWWLSKPSVLPAALAFVFVAAAAAGLFDLRRRFR